MPKHIAIYLRVSTKLQDTRSQKPDLQNWASSQDGDVKWYEDKASGKDMDRPDWQRLMDAMQMGRVSTIVCWRLDRLGRTAAGLTALFDELQKNNVNLVSLKDGVDLSTPAGRLMANVLASVGQFEREVRGERVRAGQAVARANGKQWGGSVAGVRKKVTPAKEKAIIALKEQGETVSAISRAVSLSRPTIYSILGESSLAKK